MSAADTRGGAWEVVIDKAVLEVVSYLAASTEPFDPTGPLSPHMLALLDRGTLIDIVKERNFNQLCGRLGCAERPSGLQAAATAPRNVDFSRWSGSDDGSGSASSSSSSPPRARDGAPAADENPMAKEGDLTLSAARAGAEAELEYGDDADIAEAFRLAARGQRLLRRLHRREKEQRERALRERRQTAPAAAASAPAVAARSAMLGATTAERFCGPLCLEAFRDELLPRVPAYLDYAQEPLLRAVSSLFPSLRADVLCRLAAPEAAATVGLARDVTERGAGPMQPVEVGAARELTLTRRSAERGDDVAALAASTAASMTRRDTLWDAAVVYRLDREGLRRAHAEPDGCGSSAARAAAAPARNGSSPRPALHGALLVMDFLFTISSSATKRLFLLHFYAQHRPPESAADTYYDRVVGPVRAVLSKKAAALTARVEALRAAPAAPSLSNPLSELLHREEDLRVEPALQDQRQQLVASQLFSADLAAALSRLLWIDVDTITGAAWEGVWRRASVDIVAEPVAASSAPPFTATSLVNSLVFPFAVPSLLLRPLALSGAGASQPEVIALGVLMLLAAALCGRAEPAVRDSDEQLKEVLDAVGMSTDDTTAALRALMLSADD